MKFIDRNSDYGRVPDDVRPLVRGLLENTRRFSADDGNDAPYVTDALKYTARSQDRRSVDEYTGGDSFVESIIDVFGFQPLDFQVESWQLLADLHDARTTHDESQAAILSAPTGFGKTEGFLGPLYQLLRDDDQDMAVLVYPSRALLQDQLSRILEHFHDIRSTSDDQLSVGIWMGNMPYQLEDVETNRTVFSRSGSTREFRLADCWCSREGESHSFIYSGGNNGYDLVCEHDSSHTFSHRELQLSRTSMRHGNHPDIMLTTLESLELFGLKPNYDIIHHADTIVFDEIHLYTGLRGAHTANIVKNIEAITDDPLLWVGSSATVDDAERFAGKIFPVDDDRVVGVAPSDSDFDTEHDDKEHYYFLKATEDGPGVSSMFIQQLLLLGHGVLQPVDGSRGKILSFIDSISQVNQKRSQLEDADHTRRLWEHHLDTGGEGDWDRVAEAMGYEFLREDLSFSSVYSDVGFDASVVDSDVLLSTNFLEVGIDVGDISMITQYRTPWNLSSFVQRVGRAARTPGTDSHVFVFLSDLTSDANMFYRADRFLGSEIRTPLKIDNEVVAWIHDQFEAFYRVASDIQDRRYFGRKEKEFFHEEFLVDELEWDDYHTLLIDPSTVLERELDIHDSFDPLTGQEPIVEVLALLEEERDDLDDLAGGHSVSGDQTMAVRDTILEYIHERAALVEECAEHPEDVVSSEVLDQLSSQLTEAREAVQTETDPEESTVDQFQRTLPTLFDIMGNVLRVKNAAEGHELDLRDLRYDVQDVQEDVDRLRAFSDDDERHSIRQKRQQIYYLMQALEQLHQYQKLESNHLSLYFVKYLLRGGYYYDRFLRAGGDSLDGEVWYIPENYFDDAGKYVTVFHGDDDIDGSEEPVDKLVHSYTPYRSEYQHEAGQLQAFLPPTEVDDGTVRFDFSDIQGDRQGDVLVPDAVSLSDVTDLSGSKALNIVRYCPECFQVLDIDSCLRHNTSKLGKIHASPQVETELTGRDDEASRGGVTLADISGKVLLTGVSLQITPATSRGPGDYIFTGGDRIEQLIESPKPTIGFTLDTRGLLFDVSGFLETVDDDLVARAGRYKSFDDLSPTETAVHTAAHFYTQLVADLAGISPASLFYGFDIDDETVYVFERSQGGQGIVDLVFDDVREDPAAALDGITRIAYNPQVLNERLWADESFVESLSVDADRDRIAELVRESDIAPVFDHVTDLLVEEVQSSVDRVRQLAREEALSQRTVAEIKHVVARERVGGAEDYPEDAVAAVDPMFEGHDRAETLFFSPDIDGCVDNLHLSECISTHDQSDTLSYVMLEALREEVIERVPTDEVGDGVFDHETLPGGEYGDTSVFVTL